MLMNLSPSKLDAAIPALESFGISVMKLDRISMSTSTMRRGSFDPDNLRASTSPTRIPFRRTGAFSVMPEESSMNVRS